METSQSRPVARTAQSVAAVSKDASIQLDAGAKAAEDLGGTCRLLAPAPSGIKSLELRRIAMRPEPFRQVLLQELLIQADWPGGDRPGVPHKMDSSPARTGCLPRQLRMTFHRALEMLAGP